MAILKYRLSNKKKSFFSKFEKNDDSCTEENGTYNKCCYGNGPKCYVHGIKGHAKAFV